MDLRHLNLRVVFAFSFAAIAFATPAHPTGLNAGLDSLASRIAFAADSSELKRIAVFEFADLDGEVNEMGNYVAEELVTRLVQSELFQVLDARVVREVLEDENLPVASMLNPEAGDKLRKTLKLDAIVTGVVAGAGSSIRLSARVISVASGVITAAAAVDVQADSLTEELFGRSRLSRLGPGSSLRVEGESLHPVAKTAGDFEVQRMSGWGNQWSGNAQGWWSKARLSDRLTLALPLERSGRYRLTAQFTKAQDYGNVQLYLDGRRLGESFSGYAPKVVPSGAVDLGVQSLRAGDHTLLVEVSGEAPQVERGDHGLGFGLDYIEFARTR
jgi:TolB-like protein